MKQKTTLIIGGTRGIGLVVKEALLKRGDLVYTASRSKSVNRNHYTINIPDEINIDKNIKLNYLIFTHRYRNGKWDDDFNITVKGVDKIINLLKDSFLDEASIVILSSNASHFVLEDQPAFYHATRAAIEGLTRYYAVTLGYKGIRCNCVLPTTIIKPENKHFFLKDNEIRKMIELITPLCRMGNADDIAGIVEFLCSKNSSFITGQSFFIDGGLSVRGQESIARQIISIRK